MSGEVPEDWQTAKVGDLVSIKTGKLDANAAVKGGQYKFFTCSRNDYEIDSYSFDADAIIIAGNGDLNVKRYCGKFDAYQRTYVLTSKNTNILDTNYFFFWESIYVDRLRDLSIGGVIKYIKLGMLADVEIPIPPLPEQQRIAEILSSVDESIRATEAVISQAERVKRGLMEDLLTGGLGSAAIANGEVPEGWRNSELRSLCIIAGEYGANAPKSEFDPDLPRYVRITDIDEDGNLLPDTLVSIPREVAEPYILEEGDIVIARSGATVGKSYMHIKSNGECAFAGYLVRFRADRNVANPKWIKFNLQSEYFWAWVRDNQRAGAQPNINAKEYGGLLLCVPPLPEQQRISEILSSVDDQITTNRATVEQLQRLKRGLMDDLLTGKVRTVA